MLLLKRRAGQVIRIDDDIVVRLEGVGARQVSLGIAAPGTVRIYPGEIYRAIVTGNLRASATP